jgi:hypothetical protein
LRLARKGFVSDQQVKAAQAKESQKVESIEHIVFAMKYVASFHGTRDFNPNKVPLWKNVEASKKVRDRVVHPKTLSDLVVTLNEHIDCKCALAWLINCLTFAETFERRLWPIRPTARQKRWFG